MNHPSKTDEATPPSQDHEVLEPHTQSADLGWSHFSRRDAEQTRDILGDVNNEILFNTERQF